MKSYKDFISESEQLDERFRLPRLPRLPGRGRVPGRGPKPGGRGPKPGGRGPRGPRGPGGGGGNPFDAIQNFAGGLLGGMVWDGAKWVAGEAMGILKQPIGQEKTQVAKGNDQPGLSRVT